MTLLVPGVTVIAVNAWVTLILNDVDLPPLVAVKTIEPRFVESDRRTRTRSADGGCTTAGRRILLPGGCCRTGQRELLGRCVGSATGCQLCGTILNDQRIIDRYSLRRADRQSASIRDRDSQVIVAAFAERHLRVLGCIAAVCGERSGSTGWHKAGLPGVRQQRLTLIVSAEHTDGS